MKINRNEVQLVGKWEFIGGKVVADSVCNRIADLVEYHLEKVATDSSGWNTLYLDPLDKRFWERIYPDGELQGGGPPTLRNISAKCVKQKYDYIQPKFLAGRL